MPWKESRVVDQRLQFLSSYQREEMSVSELCREFGVSRPTDYRWINRYKESGPEFTITDAHSRYLIRCQIVSQMDLSQVRAVCEATMREYGMPSRIRTDNGAPFTGTGLLGLSKLSLGWMKIGIIHERIQPGRPQQNGRHERMHRTLKEETTRPAALTLRLQQKKFDRFRQVFNSRRPRIPLSRGALIEDQQAHCARLHSEARDTALREGMELETRLLEGYAVDAIVRFLLDNKADLLVIGLHRHASHISRLWSTVYDVALDAPCSVLGVH
jgi:transposase InsO family protein